MSDSLFFSLIPADERVPLDTLQQAVAHMSAILRGVDQSASRSWRRPRIWYVVHLSSSAPTFEVAPVEMRSLIAPDTFPDTARVLVDGLASLAVAPMDSPPGHFSEDELNRLQRMRTIFRRGGGLARIDSWAAPTDTPVEAERPQVASVSDETSEHAAKILGSGYTEYGSIQGELGALRVRGTPMMTVWDEVHRRAVHCYFPREQLELVKTLLERRVRISGRVRYYNDGRPAGVSAVDEIRDMSPRTGLPRAEFGSIPDLTGGRDTVEYLRLVRDEAGA